MNTKYFVKIIGALVAAVSLTTCHPWQWEDLPKFNPDCPVVESLSHTGAPFDTIVTVFGSGFDANSQHQFTLTINGIEVPILDMKDSTSLRFRVPKGLESGVVKVGREGSECETGTSMVFSYEYTEVSTAVFATQLNKPIGLDVDDNGNVFVADRNAHNIKMITSGGSISVIAGSTTGQFGWLTHPNGTSARFTFPTDVAIGATGVIYVADEGNNSIRKIEGEGTSRGVSNLVGQPDHEGDNNFGEIPFSNVLLTAPRCIATDRNHKVFITEPALQNIRVIDEDAKTVRKIQVNGTTALNYPSGTAFSIARDNNFPLFVANHDSQKVQAINPTTGSGVTISPPSFSTPTDIVLDDDGIIYVLDRGSNKIFILYQDGSYSTISVSSPTVNPNPNSLAGIALDKQRRIIYLSDEVKNMIYKVVFE
ncbi:MAG: IPT/TIG domain-containing protein [Saprospiraceae bacterium]